MFWSRNLLPITKRSLALGRQTVPGGASLRRATPHPSATKPIHQSRKNHECVDEADRDRDSRCPAPSLPHRRRPLVDQSPVAESHSRRPSRQDEYAKRGRHQRQEAEAVRFKKTGPHGFFGGISR